VGNSATALATALAANRARSGVGAGGRAWTALAQPVSARQMTMRVDRYMVTDSFAPRQSEAPSQLSGLLHSRAPARARQVGAAGPGLAREADGRE